MQVFDAFLFQFFVFSALYQWQSVPLSVVISVFGLNLKSRRDRVKLSH